MHYLFRVNFVQITQHIKAILLPICGEIYTSNITAAKWHSSFRYCVTSAGVDLTKGCNI